MYLLQVAHRGHGQLVPVLKAAHLGYGASHSILDPKIRCLTFTLCPRFLPFCREAWVGHLPWQPFPLEAGPLKCH